MAVFHGSYPLLIRKIFKKRFAKFLLVGLLGTAIDFSLFYFLNVIFGIVIITANVISYGTGLTCSFFINRMWTFADSEKRSKKLVFHSLILGYIGLFLNTWMVLFFSSYVYVMVAKSIAVLVIVIYNYATNKYLVFRIK